MDILGLDLILRQKIQAQEPSAQGSASLRSKLDGSKTRFDWRFHWKEDFSPPGLSDSNIERAKEVIWIPVIPTQLLYSSPFCCLQLIGLSSYLYQQLFLPRACPYLAWVFSSSSSYFIDFSYFLCRE